MPIEVDTEQEKPQPAIQPARRPIASRSARPMIALAAYLAKKSITPNQISILSVVFALIGAVLVLFWNNPLSFLVGGGAEAILIGTALYPLTPFSPLQSAGMATAIVIAGFFGGFVLSAVKRDLGAKDWGTPIEGHGGVLDRVDSITFSAPILFHLTRYWFSV